MASRITQHGLEVLRTDTAVTARNTHTAAEAARTPTGFEARHTHMVLQTLRVEPPGVPAAARIFPVNQAKRVNQTTSAGARIFPI